MDKTTHRISSLQFPTKKGLVAWQRLTLLAATLGFVCTAAGHPTLWYDASDREILWQRKLDTHAPIYDPLKQGVDYFLGSNIARNGLVTWQGSGQTHTLGDRRDIGNSLLVFAFMSELTQEAPYFDLARRWLLSVAAFGSFDLDGTHDLVQAHLLAGMAGAYDILAPSLSGYDNQLILAAITRNATELRAAGLGGIWWESEFLQNHNWVNHAAVGLAALATMEDLPSSVTEPWLSYASENAQAVKASLDTIVDGTWHEGFAYAAYGLTWHLPFVTALARVTGVELGDIEMLRGHGSARAHLQLPNAANKYVMTHGDFFGFSTDDDLVVLRYGATKFQDGMAQAAADFWTNTVSASSYAPEMAQRVFEFLFYEPSIAAADLNSEALDWHGNDMQTAVFRSGWDPWATVFALKSGPFGGSSAFDRMVSGGPPVGGLNIAHDHADDNGFYLYGNGTWLAPEAAGYYIGHHDSPLPAANKTVFHNSLLIDENGQLGEGIRDRGDEVGRYSWAGQRTASISTFGSSQHFAYAVGDGARLYPSEYGLQRWDRHVLFLDRKWIVLRDVIESSASHDYAWLCHFMEGVTREGNWLHGYERDGQALGVAVVAPSDWDLTVTQQSPVNIGRLNPSGSVYASRVKPAWPTHNATFLTALVPVAEADWASRPALAPLDDQEPQAGFWLWQDGQTIAAVFNDDSSGSRSIGDFQLDGLTGVAEYDGDQPSRALLVSGTGLSDARGTLLAQGTEVAMLEADGLSSEVVSVSGDGILGAWVYAPYATQVMLNDVEVPFSRYGEYILVGEDGAQFPN